ncbi:MAG: MFS transporter [Flavipsychrobacter sp.]|nr:MFS transporter [Flavipsychrobacter sp.]
MPPAISFLQKNEALSTPHFKKYLTMRVLVTLALNMQSTIMYYWVYHLTNDVAQVGILGLFEVIPAIGCSFFSGHFVDMREKKGIILQCVIAYVLLAAGFTWLATPAFGRDNSVQTIVHLVYAGIFIGGALRAFISPATFALMAGLLPRKHYANGTTWSSGAWQAGAVLGPLMAGVMLSFGVDISFAITFLLMFLGMAAVITIPRQAIVQKDKEPILKSLREGLKFVFSTQVILAALSLDMFAVLFGGATALLPAYAKDILHVGEIGFGWLRAAPGIGSVLTLGILSFLPLKNKPGIKLLGCIAGFGLSIIVFGISTSFILSFLMLLVGGMFDAVSVVIRGTILQIYTPDKVRGRVAAVNTMFISSSNELGAVESGYTAKWMGMVPSVVFGGCMTLVVVGVTFLAAPMLRVLNLSGEDKAPEKV